MSPAREIALVEPFKKMELSVAEQGMSEEDVLSSRYTAGVGAALRSVV